MTRKFPDYDYLKSPTLVGSYSTNLDLLIYAATYRFAGQKPRILDYGAGEGIYADQLTRNAECVAYDPAPNALAAVQQTVVVRDPSLLSPRSFHAIHIKEVLEHAEDLTSVFSHIAQLLVVGGVVMATFRDIGKEEAMKLNEKHKPAYPIYPLNEDAVVHACQLNGISIPLRTKWFPNNPDEDWYEYPIERHVLTGQLTIPE